MESLVVPVLPYKSTRFNVACALAAVPTRATSCSSRLMMKAFRESIARTASVGSGGWLSTRTLPFWSVILVTSQGLIRYPPLANTA